MVLEYTRVVTLHLNLENMPKIATGVASVYAQLHMVIYQLLMVVESSNIA